MSDLELLFLVLIVVYAWECACWVRRGSVALRTWLGRRWQLLHPGTLLGNQRGGLVFAHPFPPLGAFLSGNQFPLSLTPNTVLAFVAPNINPGPRPEQTGKLFRFAEIRTADARGKKVLVNGQLLLRAASPTFASTLARLLQAWSKTSAVEREKQIQQLYRDSLDAHLVQNRWKDFQQQTSGLRMLTNVLFGYLFVFTPLLIWRFGLRACWFGLLLGLLACTTTTALLFHRAHKRFYPHAEDERFTHFLLILLAPATTIRAHDTLSRPLLEKFHPLAIAKVFCREPEFRAFARRLLLELRHPALPVCPADEPAAQEVERSSRALLRNEVEQFLRQGGLTLEELVTPPTPADESCRSYCPRCQAQFTTAEGVCDDCGGLRLVRFSPPATRA